ncbi:MAG: hypothetical protein KME08_18105 [Aphanothece sp. CMT-3BRIN-NPC111]|nr:hypothetical protein [Aphanothece sp. CMT-3BRIN-NPC111]
MSLEHKIYLLTKIAAINFKKSRYFFEQGEVERCITDYLRSLPNAQPDQPTLQRDSKAVLKSIESQHGLLVERARKIYSFSHLTFQEYFTARAVINSFELETLKDSVSHITNKSWREIFLLAANMMPDADDLLLLMKERVDTIVASNEKLQQFLAWVSQKSLSVEVSYKLTAVRAFYLVLALAPNLGLGRNLDIALARDLDPDLDIALTDLLTLSRDVDRDLVLALALARTAVGACDLALDIALVCNLIPSCGQT